MAVRAVERDVADPWPAVRAALRWPVLPPAVVFGSGVASLGWLSSGNANAVDLDVVRLAAWLLCALAAAVLLDARPREPLGLLLTVLGTVPLVVTVAAELQDGPRPGVAEAVREAPGLLAPGLALLLVGLPLAFPSGWPRDRVGRWCGVWAVGCVGLASGASALAAGSLGPADGALSVVRQIAVLALLPAAAVALSRQVSVFRSGAGDARHRAGWLLAGSAAVGLAALGVVVLDRAIGSAAATYAGAAVVAVSPVALVTLVLLTRVAPVERTLLRAALLLLAAGVLALAYVLSVVLLEGTALPDPRAAATTLTALVALLLVPAYVAVRDRALVRVFGPVHRPQSAMALLGRSVDAAVEVADAVDAAAAAVARAVRSPAATVVLGPVPDVEGGSAVLPLVAGDEVLGTLVVSPRRPGEAFERRELELLAVLVPPVAQLARAALLARDLERSRGDAVAQRLDERRRLRRDLHDSVGPLLAGLGLQADAVRRVAPDDLRSRLDAVGDAVRACRQEVRRLVDGLESGASSPGELTVAVRELVADWASAVADTGLVLDVQVPAALPPLGEEVRTAAYRIVGEALTNVVRHAQAGRCTVRLLVDGGELVVEVRDDGRGTSASSGARAGFGLRSMGERAVALGGEVVVGPAEGGRGTSVRARLPVTP